MLLAATAAVMRRAVAIRSAVAHMLLAATAAVMRRVVAIRSLECIFVGNYTFLLVSMVLRRFFTLSVKIIRFGSGQ